MSGIDAFLERFEADTADRVEKTFVVLAAGEINIDDAFDGVDDLVLVKGGSQYLADAGVFRARAAELQLVIFDAFLVDAEHADVARMMMAAGIDAAGDLDLEFADVVLAIEIGKALGNALCDRDRPGIGEI